MTLSTYDIGILIRDRIEGDSVAEHDWSNPDTIEVVNEHEINFVDVGNADIPIVHVNNGQKFKITIVEIVS